MYSDSVIAALDHKLWSSTRAGPHNTFSEAAEARSHNAAVAEKKEQDPVAAEMGRRLRAEREFKSWTLDRLALETGWTQADADNGKAVGLSPTRLGNYERGERALGHAEAEILAEVFGLHAAYFLAAIDEYEANVLLAIKKGPKPARGRR